MMSFKTKRKNVRFFRRAVVLTIAGFAGVSIGWFGRLAINDANRFTPSSSVHSVSPSPSTATLQSSQPSLTVPDLIARSYGGGLIVVDKDLPGGDGYSLQVVQYESDGNRIYALRATPTSLKPALGYPAVVTAHGFMNPHDFSTENNQFLGYMIELARRGIVAVSLDYRGHGRSGGAAESAYYSSGYAVDALNLLASLKLERNINPHALGILGYSLGGSVALKAAVADRDVIAAVLLAGSNAEMGELITWPMHSEQSGFFAADQKDHLVKKYGQPSDASPFWQSMTPVNYLDKLTAAVSLYHCADDASVPVTFSDELYGKLLAAGKEASYFRCTTGGHGFGNEPPGIVVSRTTDFFAAQLK